MSPKNGDRDQISLTMSKDKDKNCPGNYMIPGPELPNGDRLCLTHNENHESGVGIMMRIKHGKPIPDEARMVSPIEGTPLYRIGESVAEMKSASIGPAKVNSRDYKSGYDRVFGKKSKLYN